MNNYHLYEEIGSGAFSTIYKGRHRFSIQYVAIKMGEKREREKVSREVDALKALTSQKGAKKHRNVIEFYGFHETRNHLWEVLEYCAGGDLMRLLKDDECVPEEQVRVFARDIAEGLFYIHANGFIHCDIKPSNIVFNESGEIKIADFGLAQRLDDVKIDDEKRAQEEGKYNVTLRGSPYYMAPELFYCPPVHSRDSDIWGMGVVLYELAVGKPPWCQASFKDLVHSLLRDPPSFAAGVSSDFVDMVACMLHKDRSERIEWPHIHGHMWWGTQSLPSLGRPLPPTEHARVKKRPAAPTMADVSRMMAVAQRHLLEDSQVAGERKHCTWEDDFKVKSFDQELNFSTNEPARSVPSDSQGKEDKNRATDVDKGDKASRATSLFEDGHAASRVNENSAVAENNAQRVRTKACSASMVLHVSADRIGPKVMTILSMVDIAVKPISNNPQVEKPEVCTVSPDLPFHPMDIEDVFQCTNQKLEEFLTKVYKCIAQGNLETKIATLVYLEQLCGHMQIADLVANSSLLRLVLKMIRVRSSDLRVRLWSLIGQLLRHSTFLEPNIQSLGIFQELMQALTAPKDDKMEMKPRRKAAAALGELLFYVATQPPTKDQQQWRVPQSTLSGVVQILCNTTEDSVVLHYLTKSVENVTTQSPQIAHRWFLVSSFELSVAFQNYAMQRDQNDHFRNACLGALAMLSRIAQNNVVAALSNKGQHVDLTIIRWGLLGELAPKGISPAFQLLLTVVLYAKDAMVDEELILRILHISQPRAQVTGGQAMFQRRVGDTLQVSIILRCKALLFLVLIAQRDPHWLCLIFTNGFGQSLDKLSREEDSTTQQTVTEVVHLITEMLLPFVESLIGDLKAFTDKFTDERVHKFHEKLHVPVHLLSCAPLRPCLLAPSVLSLLGTLIATEPPAQHKGIQRQLLLLAEAFSGHIPLLCDAPSEELFPFLEGIVSALLVCDENESLFVGMKAFTDLYVGLATEGIEGLNDVFLQVVPALPHLLTANDPLPSWTLKLIASYLHDAPARHDVLERIREPLTTALSMPLTTYSCRVAAGMLQRHVSFDATPMIAQLRHALRIHTQETDDESQIAMDTHVLTGGLCLLEAALQEKINFVDCVGPLVGVLPPLMPISFHLCDRALTVCERATRVFSPVPFSAAEAQSLLVVLDSTSLPGITDGAPSAPSTSLARRRAITIIHWTNCAEKNEVLLRGLSVLLQKLGTSWDQGTVTLAKQCLHQFGWQRAES